MASPESELDERGFTRIEGLLAAGRRQDLVERIEALFALEGDAAGAEFKRVEVVGAVTERPGVVHVVTRMFVGAASLPDLEIEKLVVVSLERGASGWGVSLSGEMKGMAGVLKAQLQAKERAKAGK